MRRPELVPITVRMPRELHERLQVKAERERSSMNREVVLALEWRLRNVKRGKAK